MMKLVKPIAVRVTRGAWYQTWRLVSLDGSTLDVADEKVNEDAFSRPGASRGTGAYPQIHFVSLVENATTCCSAARWRAAGLAKSRWPRRCSRI